LENILLVICNLNINLPIKLPKKKSLFLEQIA
jgi:hypothetical protein